METKTALRIVSSVIGVLIVAFALYQGYGAYTSGEYGKLFIPFIILMVGINIFFLGARGRTALKPLGSKLIGVGVGLLMLSIFLSYVSVDPSKLKEDIGNTMIETIAKASADEVKRQLEEGEFTLPDDIEVIRRECANAEYEERGFSAADICEDIDKEENNDLGVEDIIIKSINRKTKQLAEEQVNEELNENGSFDSMFDEMDNMKRYVILLGFIGVLGFMIGCVFSYYGRDEGKGINNVVYAVSKTTAITCMINAVVFKLFDYFLTSYFITGKIADNPLLRSIAPAGENQLMQEVTTNILKKVGEVLYEWLKSGLNMAFIISIILFVVFLVLAVVFFVINKREGMEKKRMKGK